MSDTLGRIVRRVTVGTTWPFAEGHRLTQAQRALSSVTGHLVTSDLNHMGEQSAHRVLWSHPGFVGFWGGPTTTTPSMAGPTVDEIDWTAPRYVVAGRTANACVGPAWVVRVGATVLYPQLVLRCRARAAVSAGSATGLYFGVSPGLATPGPDAKFDRARVTSSSFVDVTLRVQLEAADLSTLVASPSAGTTASGPPVIGDSVNLAAVTAWFGAYNTTNKNLTTDDLTDVMGLSLSLEPG